MTRLRPLLILLAALLFVPPVAAQLPVPGRNAIKAQLIAETDTPAAGETVTLALRMVPNKGWHGYWKNPGDAGAEMRAEWSLPEGARLGPIQYPVPERLIISGIMNYVYNGPYAPLIELSVPPGLSAGTRLPLRAKLDYLACTDQICVPETSNVALDLIVGARGAPLARRAEFNRYRQTLPKPLGSPARFELIGGRLRMAVPLPEDMPAYDNHFFPVTEGVLQHSAVQTMSQVGDLLVIEVDAAPHTNALERIEGIFKIGDHQGLWVTATPGAVPPLPEPSSFAKAAPVGASTIFVALLGALLGGLLLNIMPCVFPILSLKALSLAKSGGSESKARRDALAYGAGVILTCLALGAALLSLRAGGAAVGWAFQLQDPRVILFLLLLVTAIALNLSGLFELPSFDGGGRLARTGGTGGAFWTGALAAFVATPCTGPFMGAALGTALLLPTGAALAVFAGLGLGLALPFLLLGFVPALRRMLPKPGAWMGRFRRLMALPMFATALGLAWILGRQSGPDGMALGIAAALVVGLALWWLGRRQGSGSAWVPLAPAAVAGLAAILLIPTATAPAAAKAEGLLPSETFSPGRLAALQAEQRPVFVYFTADWCVTCKVNEKAAIERQEVADAFADRKVAVLVGDWTRGDPEIGRFLAQHGRSGVPLYLYYGPGKGPEILPQVLTSSRLVQLAG